MSQKTNLSANQVNLIGWLCLLVLALGACAPVFLRPFPIGDDFAFHVGSWVDVVKHWHEGVPFAGWNGVQSFGLGQPTHLFYPPLSIYLGAALMALAGAANAPALFILFCIVLAALSMRSLAAEYLSPEQSWLAALLYALNPYLLLDIWVRSAFAEALSLALLPLLFKPLLRLRTLRDAVLLGLFFALQVFCNLPSAVIAGYSIAAIVLIRFVSERHARVVGLGMLGAGLGVLTSSLVILPVAFEKGSVNLPIVLGFDWRLFFLPGRDPLFTIPMLAIAAVAIGTQLFGRIYAAHPRLRALFVFSNVALLLVTVLSTPLYQSLPALANVQFPWRWLMALALASTVMLAVSVPVDRAMRKAGFHLVALITTALLLCVSTVVFYYPHKARPARRVAWGTQQSLVMLREPVAEYLPAGVPLRQFQPLSVQVSTALLSTPGVKVDKWQTEHRRIAVDSSTGYSLLLPIVSYPGWNASVDGRSVATAKDANTGLIRVDVPAGQHTLELVFRNSRYRFYGLLGSVVSLTFAAAYLGRAWLRHVQKGIADRQLDRGAAQLVRQQGLLKKAEAKATTVTK